MTTDWHRAFFPEQTDVDPNVQVEADRAKGAAQWASQHFSPDAERNAKAEMLASGKVTQEQLDRAADLAAGVRTLNGKGHA